MSPALTPPTPPSSQAIAQWNDSRPAGTRVLVSPAVGAPFRATTAAPAFLHAGRAYIRLRADLGFGSVVLLEQVRSLPGGEADA